MTIRNLIILTILCWGSLVASAEDKVYRSGSIKAAITKLGLANVADTLPCGLSTLAYKGRRVYLRINSSREVSGIGMPLFSKTVRHLQPSPIYDFLEYALLDHTFSISDDPFTYRSLRFTKGAWRDLQQVNDSTPVLISNIDGKHYKITWGSGKRTIAEVVFPIQYDMLSGSTHTEMEANFIRDLGRHSAPLISLESLDTRSLDGLELRLADGDDRFYVRKGERLYAENITGDTYYRMGRDSVCHLLHDRGYPAETLCNLLLTGAVCNKAVAVTVMRQDFTQEVIRTDVSTLSSFLRASGCRCFFGLRRNTDKELSFSLYAENGASGYVHLFMFTCSPRSAIDGKLPMEAKAYLYIPTSNIKSLFAERQP